MWIILLVTSAVIATHWMSVLTSALVHSKIRSKVVSTLEMIMSQAHIGYGLFREAAV